MAHCKQQTLPKWRMNFQATQTKYLHWHICPPLFAKITSLCLSCPLPSSTTSLQGLASHNCFPERSKKSSDPRKMLFGWPENTNEKIRSERKIMRSSSERINIAASAQRIDVDNRIALRYYYRIADNILKQVLILSLIYGFCHRKFSWFEWFDDCFGCNSTRD